jgi:hypothetical protein
VILDKYNFDFIIVLAKIAGRESKTAHNKVVQSKATTSLDQQR